MNPFETLISELGSVLGISLEAEQGRFCKLDIKGKIKIQIEYEEPSDSIRMACFVIALPPGKFREDVLSAALKANHIDPSSGTFAYAEGAQSLMLQLLLPCSVSPALMATLLGQLTEKGIEWKEAAERGNIHSLVTSTRSGLPSPMKFS